ncbi:MAG: prepilin-type N-terminal cleavage/methylation domain-containing protein [Desulfovibrio sp.]|nr:prepilin-type N-terminal cleavage/methylation domain-containing protein [Desulfovibrio sp.]
MPIFITRTRRNAADGFTLLELLFCLAIIGAALALGIGFFQPRTGEMEEFVAKVSRELSRARVEAMLAGEKTVIEFSGDRLYSRERDGSRREIAVLPVGARASVNGKFLATGKGARVEFGPLGYARENLIQLESPRQTWSIYLPSLASPITREGVYTLEELRKEKP